MTAEPWITTISTSRAVWRSRTREKAQNEVEHPYLHGLATVRNEVTGETWERRSGSWFRIEPGKPKGVAP